jgi:hypothetical protein
MKRVLLRICIFLPLCFCACSSFAPDNLMPESKTAQLERRISQLEEKLAQLEEDRKRIMEIISNTNGEPIPVDQTAPTTDIKKRISKLEEDNEHILDIISNSNCESISANQIGPASPTGEPWNDVQNWRKLKRGMSTETVIGILGNPERINTYVFGESWRYPGGGSIEFDAGGNAESWSEPW